MQNIQVLGWIIGSTFLISLGALVGALTLAINKEKLNKILMQLVSLSAGALMGGAFLHLLPEAVEEWGNEVPFYLVLGSFLAFFVVEKVMHWHHCHKYDCEEHMMGRINLMADGVHNFIDGLIIAAAFLADKQLGIVTFLAVALHEIPQEIGDFGVLMYAGWGRKKALIANFLVALTVVVGGLVGYGLSSVEEIIRMLVPIAAGGFIYISTSDLIPEIKKEQSMKKTAANFLVFLVGLGLMWLLKLVKV